MLKCPTYEHAVVAVEWSFELHISLCERYEGKLLSETQERVAEHVGRGKRAGQMALRIELRRNLMEVDDEHVVSHPRKVRVKYAVDQSPGAVLDSGYKRFHAVGLKTGEVGGEGGTEAGGVEVGFPVGAGSRSQLPAQGGRFNNSGGCGKKGVGREREVDCDSSAGGAAAGSAGGIGKAGGGGAEQGGETTDVGGEGRDAVGEGFAEGDGGGLGGGEQEEEVDVARGVEPLNVGVGHLAAHLYGEVGRGFPRFCFDGRAVGAVAHQNPAEAALGMCCGE